MKIGIGLTTYRDVRSPEVAVRVFEALFDASPRLAPTAVSIINARYDVRSAEEFSQYWCSERVLAIHPKYGATPPPIQAEIGPTWKVKGALSGYGEVHFPAANDPNSPSGITLHHTFSEKVDWERLFKRLVAFFGPAHAMLHLFTERELKRAGTGRFAFTQAFAGENQYTSWQSSLGEWRRPDKWQLEDRRRYRFLPELAWANAFGPEFDGRYDEEHLRQEAASLERSDGIVIAQITNQISDVARGAEGFETARSRMKCAFGKDVFRT